MKKILRIVYDVSICKHLGMNTLEDLMKQCELKSSKCGMMYGIDNSSTVSGHCAGDLIFQNQITSNKKCSLLLIYRTDAILKNTPFFKAYQKRLLSV